MSASLAFFLACVALALLALWVARPKKRRRPLGRVSEEYMREKGWWTR